MTITAPIQPRPADGAPVPDSGPTPGRRRLRYRGLLIGAFLVVLAAAGVGTGVLLLAGETFTVNSTADATDAAPGDGACATSTGVCTVRAAVQESNALPGAQSVGVRAGVYELAIAPFNTNGVENGDLDVTGPMTFVGAGAATTILDGGNPPAGSPPGERGMDRLFEIHEGSGDVTFRNLTIREGYTDEAGGGIEFGTPPPSLVPGAPVVNGTLTLQGVTIKDSYGSKAGGGVNNVGRGRVVVIGSTLSGNATGGSGAAINNATTGTVEVLAGSRIVDNPGPYVPDPLHDPASQDPPELIPGPGVYEAGGGALANEAEAGAVGTLRVIGSTVAGNTGGSSGAGIANLGDGTVVLENTTITNNRSEAGGGGLYSASGVVTITGTTFTGNIAGDGGAAQFGGDLTGVGLRPRVTITGGTVVDNVAEASGGGLDSGGDGQLTLNGVLVQGNDAGAAGGGVHNGDLSTLTVTGGRIVGNTAMDYGGGLAADSGRSTTVTGVEISGNSALGEPEPETPTLPGDSAGGGGAHTDGAGAVRFVDVDFLNNTASGDGGGLAMHGLGTADVVDSVVRGNMVVCEECSGGGIEQSGANATLLRVLVENNTATANGGGIHNSSSGEFTVLDTTMARNTAEAGGGFANQSDSTLVIRGSLIIGNRAKNGPRDDHGLGGGLVSISDGGGVIENTTISGNSATVGGGGMFHDADAPMLLSNVTIWGNSAPVGGAVGVVESDFVPSIPPQANAGLTARNTIVGGSLSGGTCDAFISTQGGNLDTGATCFLQASPEGDAPAVFKDRRNVRLSLDAIADNGGPTMTHAIPENSIAIDSGIASLANADGSTQGTCPQFDQRGEDRPVHLACDSGAYEYDGPAPAVDVDLPDTQYLDGPVQNSEETQIFTFTGTDATTPAADLQFECRLLPDDPTDPLVLALRGIPPGEPLPPELAFGGCSSPWSVPLTEEGNFIFQVQAVDRAGNVDPTPAEHRFNGTDIIPPNTVVTERPAAEISGRSATFSFVAEDNLTPSQFATFECRMDSRDPEAWVECFSPMSFGDLTTGPHTFEVRAYDTAENVDPSPARITFAVGAPGNCNDANLTLRPAGDAWVDEVNPGQNSSFQEFLTVRSGDTPGNAARALVNFTLPSDAPTCQLQRATLRFVGEGDAGRTLTAQPLDRQWLPNTVTWASQPGAVGPVAQAPSGGNVVEFDVTEAVLAMQAGGLSNNGFRISDLIETDPAGGGDQSLASSEAPFAPPEDPDPAPQLVLLYNADAAPPPPPPDEPVGTTTVFCGQVLTVSTLVANDLTDCPGEGLVVGAPGIVVDLGGHTIDGPDYLTTNLSGQEGGFPAGIRNGGHDNVVIRNGTVQQFGAGVHLLSGTARNVVSNLTIQTNAVAGVELLDADDGRNGNTIENSRIRGNELGVHVFTGSDNSRVVGGEITGNLGEAVLIAASKGTVIENNLIHGIPFDPALDSDGGFGLVGASDSRIIGNTIRDTGDAGLVLSQGSNDNLIENNTMYRNGDAGVSVGDSRGNRIIGNTAHQESDGGVVLNGAPDTVITDNDLRFNPNGIETAEADNLVLERNDASDSQADGFAIGNGVNPRVVGNTAHRTGGTGISIEGAAFDANGNPDRPGLIEGNLADENLAEGISVAGGGHTVRGNAAYNNAGSGISAEGNLDGGANLASGNGGLADCLGVVCGAGTAPPPAPTDVTAPETLITVNPGPRSGTTATFEFTSEDAGTPVTAMVFECRLDPGPDPVTPIGPDPVDPPDVPDPNLPPAPPEPPDTNSPPDGAGWAECISPVTFTALEPGAHRFEVRALDQAQLRDETPAFHDWSVEVVPGGDGTGTDTVAPNTTIRQAPVSGPATDVRFVFTGSDNATAGPDLVLECRLDGVTAWTTPCPSPRELTGLGVGSHTFEARAVDRSGNTDASPATHTWDVTDTPPDTVAPIASIDSGPDRTTIATSATFTLSANEPGAEFRCGLDLGAFQPCTTPHTVSGLLAGEHRLTVYAVDAAGNMNGNRATFTWTVTAPAVTTQVVCGDVITVNTRIDNDLLDCLSDGLVIGADNVTLDLDGHSLDGTGLGAGVSTGGFDNVTITGGGSLTQFDVGVELAPGTVGGIVDGITAEQNQVAGVLLTDADGAVVRGTTLTGNDIGVMLQKGSSGALIRDNTIGASGSSGVHVERSDGNRVERNLIVGGGGPGVLIGGARDNTVLANTLEGTGGGVSVALNELTKLLEVQRPPDPTVPEPAPPAPETTGLPSSGNTARGNTITETGGPGLLIEGAQGANSVRNTLVDNSVDGANGAGVELYYAADNTVAGNDVTDNKAGIDLTTANRNRIEGNDASRSDGTGIEVNAGSLGNDLVDNVSNDNNGGGIAVSDPAAIGSGNVLDGNTANNNGSTGIALTDIAHVVFANIALDNEGWGIDAKPGTIDRGGNRATGNKELPQCANVRCDAGQGPADTIPPETLVLSGPAAEVTSPAATFRFAGTDNAGVVTFECRVDGTGPAGWVACETGYTVNGVAVGPHRFEVRSVDEAGNPDATPATHEWTVVAPPPGVAPVTTLTGTPDATTSATAATFTFTANEPVARFECRLGAATFGTCQSQSQQSYTGLVAGPYTFEVRAVDTEGLTGAPATFTWTVAAAPAATTVSCGEILTTSVTLANDLIDCEGTALVIGADGITVDLGGFTVDGTGTGSGILNPRHDRVAVTNGTVSEFETGVEFGPGAGHGTLSGLRLTLNGVAGVLFADADDAGVGNTVRDSELTGNAVGVLAGPGTRGTVVRGNLFTANTEEAVRLELAGAARVEDNTITGSGGPAVAMERSGDNVVRRNTLSDNAGGGIAVGAETLPSNGNRVTENTLTDNGFGILVTDSTDVTVADNDVRGSAGAGVGLELSDGNRVTGNALAGNGSGVSLNDSSDNLVQANDASAALGVGIELGPLSLDNLVLRNAALGNGGAGITVEDLAPAGRGNTIDGNTANDNAGDGIYVGQSGHFVGDNRAINNGGWGIYVELGTTDGGGNQAGGNIEPAQCFNIVCALGEAPGAPETRLLTFPPTASDSRYAAFTFVGSDESTPLREIVYQCRLDSRDEEMFEDCEYPQEYFTLTPGVHTFEVRSVDADQRVDPTPAIYTWTYTPPAAGAAPDTVIDERPPAASPILEGLFTFTSTEPDPAYECRIDPPANQPEIGWQVCSDEAITPALGYGFFEYAFEETQLGRHVFEVRSIDIEGLRDPSPARYEWVVSGGPLTTILSGPADVPPEPLEPLTGGETTSTSARFVYDSANEPSSTFACSLDFTEFVDCNTPAGGGLPPTVKAVGYTGLLPGEHILRIVATDPAGREEFEPATYEWEILPPVVSAPPTAQITIAPVSGTSDLTFAFTGTDDLTPPSRLVFECRVDSTVELDFEICTSPFNLLDRYVFGVDPQVAPGEHTFEVRAVDETEPTPMISEPVAHTWTSAPDTVVPQVAITARPPARTGDLTAAFAFVGADNATPSTELNQLLVFECSVNGGPFEPCTAPTEVGDLVPGPNTFAVRAVDLAGNLSAPATYTWTVVAAPVTTLVGPASPHPDSTATLTFTADQPGSTFECLLPGADWARCTSPLLVTGLSGFTQVEVRATNPEGVLEDPPALAEFSVVDSTPPDTTITFGPGPLTAANTFARATGGFTFTSTEAGSTFECALDGAPFTSCTSPAEVTGLLDGPHTFAVRALDPSGNPDGAPATRPFVVDLPPTTEVLTGPEELTAVALATFEFTSNEAGSTFECLVNTNGVSTAPMPCTSPFSYTAPQPGDYLFAVRATDPQGNRAPLYALYEWTLGLGVSITEAPPATTTDTTARFAFVSNDPSPLIRYQCSLDEAPFTLCTSPAEYLDLPAGPHTFEVQAVRAGMLGDPVPVTHTWTIVDETAPETTIASGPPPVSDSDTAQLVFTSNERNTTFECSLDGAPFSGCASPVDLDGLALGIHRFEVRAVDSAGNVDAAPAVFVWEIVADTTAPNTAITSGPPLVRADVDAVFEFAGVDTGTPAELLTFECSLDGAPAEACDAPHDVQDLLRGEHTLAVTAIDLAGNRDASPATYIWSVAGEINTLPGAGVVVDVETAPGVEPPASAELTFTRVSAPGATTIEPIAVDPSGVLPAGFQLGEQLYDIGTTATFSGPVTVCLTFDPAAFAEPLRVRLLHVENGAWVNVTSPPSELLSGIVCGRVTSLSPFALAITNEAEPDRAPDTTITAGPPATTVNYAYTVSFTGTDDLTDPLELDFECAVDGGPFESCSSPQEIEVLTDGPHSLAVRAVDAATGAVDPTPATRAWNVVDLTAPDTSIDAGPESPTFDTFAVFEFTGVFEQPTDEAGATSECAVNAGDFVPCVSPYRVDGLTTPGAQVFLVRTVDAAGNADSTPDRYEWEISAPVDGTPPDTVILGGPPATVASETLTFLTFTATQAGVEFECRTDGGPWESCESPIEYQGLPEGTYTVDVRATRTFDNAAGVEQTVIDATPASYTWAVTTPPQTTLTSPASPVAGSTATFAFASDQPGSTFACSVDGAEFTSCTSPFVVRDLIEGPHTFAVQATNALGAPDPTPVEYAFVQGLPPDTSIISTTDVTDPLDPTAVTLEIRFAGVDDRTPELELEFECRLDGGTWNGCSVLEEFVYGELPAGPHVFEVRAVDLGESVDPTPARHEFTVAAAPDVAIDLTAADTPQPQTESTTAAFTFASGQTGVTFACSLDRAPEPVFEPCTSPVTYTGLVAGPHEFTVRAIGSTGVVSAEPAVFEWEIGTLTAPNLTAVAGPEPATAATTATFSWTSSDPALSYTCALDGGPARPCATPYTLENLAATPHTLVVNGARAGLLAEPEPLEYLWEVLDQSPPETVVTTEPVAVVADTATVTMAFTGTDNGTAPAALTYECALDGAMEFTPCSSPVSFSALAPGQHSLLVRAVDSVGLTDPTPLTLTWRVVDTTAPATTVTAAPSGETVETTAVIEFTSTEPGTFRCTFDGQVVDPCTPPVQITGLGLGEHTFAVSAVDAAGNVDPNSEVVRWTVIAPPDTVPPNVALTAAPPATGSSATTATFAFAASEPGVSFTCTLDAGTAIPCTSPAQLSGLAPGAHQLRIDAVDPAGNVDPSPATHGWTVGAAPAPVASCAGPGTLTVSATADSWISQSSPSQNKGTDSSLRVQAKSGDANRTVVLFGLPTVPAGCVVTDAKLLVHASSATPGRTLQARQLTSTWAENTVRWSTTLNTTGNPATVASGAAAGYREFAVRDLVAAMYAPNANRGFLIRDSNEGGGGVSQSFSSREAGSNPPRLAVTFGQAPDTVAPNTVIDSAPAAQTAGTEAVVAFSATEPGTTYACSLDAAEFVACTSPVTTSNLAAGPHTFAVRATDGAGNVDASPATVSWTQAGTPPAPNDPAAAPPPSSPSSTPPSSTPSSSPSSSPPSSSPSSSPPSSSTPPTTTAPPSSSTAPPSSSAPPTTTSPPTTTTTAPSCAAGTVTLTANADSFIEQKDPAKNHGTDADLKLMSKPGENTRMLVRFAVPQTPLGCRIVGAELRMHDGSPKPGHTIRVQRLTSGWVETGVTWANQPAAAATPAPTAVTPSGAGRMAWDVRALVEAMVQSNANNGFLLSDVVESGNGDEQSFHGREKAPDQPPQLVITYG